MSWLVFLTGDKASTERLIASPTAAPASFLTDAGTLKLGIILAWKGDAAIVYRSHTFSSWRLDFSPGDADTMKIEVLGYLLDDSTKLLDWCARTDNIGKRYIRPTGQNGNSEDAPTGSPLVDP